MMKAHPLDRPVWNALHTRWSHLAINTAKASRLDPRYGPFAAAIDASNQSRAALIEMIPTGGEIWLVELADDYLPDFETQTVSTAIHQMVAFGLNPVVSDQTIVTLTDADAQEMRELAHATKPGPFYPLTHRLGGFVGIREKGRLIAMAGERMRLDGFTEVSGVCTYPDYRGRGYAAALISRVCQAMIERGETPFLHSYAANAGANALYASLGFSLRTEIRLTRVLCPTGQADCP
jgi:ribosomal protein S18 acetylase RimI-like enzyme